MLKNHPKGLLTLFFANMGERFGYYTMLSIFVLYLQENFEWSAATAGQVYGGFLFAIYFMPLVGGLIADRWLGYGKTIALGTVVMTLGYALISMPTDSAWPVFLALVIISLGNGMFKGNIVVIVGNLYDKEKYASLRDAAFNIYYMGINIGAFFAPYAASYAKTYFHEDLGFSLAQGYNAGFGIAAIGMVISLLVFLIFRKNYVRADYRSHEKKGTEEEIVLSPKQEKDRIVALLIVFGIVIFFWMAFHQNGFTLTLFAKNYTVSKVSPYTYMLFDLPALLSIIAVLGGVIFLLRKGAIAARFIAGVVAILGVCYGYHKLNSFFEKPDMVVCQDRIEDVEKAREQMKDFLVNTPVSRDPESVKKIKKIAKKDSIKIVEELEARAPYSASGTFVRPLKIYRIYNERFLAQAGGGQGDFENFMTALGGLGFPEGVEIPALYAKLPGTGADRAGLIDKIKALGDHEPFKVGDEEEKEPENKALLDLGKTLFVVAQHQARMMEEAVVTTRLVAEQLAKVEGETSGALKKNEALAEAVAYDAEVARNLAISLGKLSHNAFTLDLVKSVPGRISPELFQSFNPIFIVFLTPLIVGFFYWLNRRKREPSSPAKIGIGMFVTSLGFLIMVLASWGLSSVWALGGGRDSVNSFVTPYWLISTYFALTVAELFLSPMGLSFVSKVAPPKLKGLMQGGWLGATAIGNLLAGLIGVFYESWELWQFFALLAGAAFVSSILVLLVLKKLKAATES